jgi:hypothetical protein
VLVGKPLFCSSEEILLEMPISGERDLLLIISDLSLIEQLEISKTSKEKKRFFIKY